MTPRPTSFGRSPPAQRPGAWFAQDGCPIRNGTRSICAASALVFPSEYEGFGAPVVEAMVLETPVVCSTAEAVVEVAGEAAVIVAEQSPQAWATAVLRAIEQRDRLIEAGRARRDDFTLEVSGRALVAAYRQAASG